MAARKSCTKLTWDEAKAKVGGSNANTEKKKPIPKNINHGDALTAKVIAKHGASQQELSQHKSFLKKARREQERAAAAAARREEERERERADQLVKPHEQARGRLRELALQQATGSLAPETSTTTTSDIDISLSDMKQIAECKQMQLDEIMALQAIFADTEEFLVSEASNSEDLRKKIDEYQMDEEKEVLLRSVAEHPPLSLYIQLTIDGDNHLVAFVLLHVTYPQLYPLGGSTPHYEIDYFMVADRTAVCNADKPLESLAYLEETALRDALKTESGQILPDPCVYEVAVSWLSDNLFNFVTMHTHGQHSTKK